MAASNFDSLGINNFKQKSLLSGDDSWPSQKICSTPSQSRNTVTFQAFFKRDKINFLYLFIVFVLYKNSPILVYIVYSYCIHYLTGCRDSNQAQMQLGALVIELCAISLWSFVSCTLIFLRLCTWCFYTSSKRICYTFIKLN